MFIATMIRDGGYASLRLANKGSRLIAPRVKLNNNIYMETTFTIKHAPACPCPLKIKD